MANLVEHVMINKLGDELDDAITFAGGDTSNVDNIMQYPIIIRDQLGKSYNKNILIEGDSCIIIADKEGRDEYNTEYATGIKTGLNPEAYYIRICTAVKDIEPLYIDLTPITDLISEGGLINIEEIVSRIINSSEMQDQVHIEVENYLSENTTDEGINVDELNW